MGIFGGVTGLAAVGPGGGRRGHPGHRLAVDLLAERAARPARHPAGAEPAHGEPRPALGARPARPGPGAPAALGLVWGLVRGNEAGLGQPAGGRAASRRGGAHRRLRRPRAAGARAAAAAAAVRLARLLGRERGHLPAERVADRGDLLHGPVPAGHPRPGPARRRAAAAALGSGPAPARPVVRDAGRPDRRAAADRHRPAPADRRAGLDRGHRRPELSYWPWWRRWCSSGPGSRWPCPP